ncbi:MAG: sucrose phosphorylase [Woeseiaceae bacterium]|nr:sucrose phosphorylase [Woeseiaceae bacterium]
MGNAVQLINYADRLGGDLDRLRSLLRNEFRGLFGGVHILPFFDPIDGADAGFDPIDHRRVDPRLGTWDDLRAIASEYDVMADLIVNHVSADSTQFRDVRRRGRASDFWTLFIKKDDVFPPSGDGQDWSEDIARLYRPRPGRPFTAITLDDGTDVDFWTTFSPKQLDINVESDQGKAYLDSILETFAEAGVREIRLDAAGYAIKRRGTSCFMLPETFDFIGALSARAGELGMQTLVEIHSHYQTQIAIAASVGRVYDFALPPLVLHSLYTSDFGALKRWLAVAPRNCVTVLDTHDGIGIHDVARQGDLEGLLSDDEVDILVDTIHEKTNGQSRRASGYAASNLDIYQVNSTYYDALGRDSVAYLIARAIQFFAPGTPQVYYVGLLAGRNDMALVEHSGIGRDINRHVYSQDEVAVALKEPAVVQLMELIRLRNTLTVFDGTFSLVDCPQDELALRWECDDEFAELRVGRGCARATITYSKAGQAGALGIGEVCSGVETGIV